jgi:uncharacterized protein YlzI (FlbEa/FlbD family)
VIALHRLGHTADQFLLNPDLLVTVEGTPDTVVSLSTGVRMVVAESPEQVQDAVRQWRASVLTEAVRDLPRRSGGLALVRASAGEAPGPEATS